MRLSERMKSGYVKLRQFMHERISRTTGWTLFLLLAVGIPNLFGYTQFWWSIVKWCAPRTVSLLGTSTGRLAIVICGLLVIGWDQRRITRKLHGKKEHDESTLKGRALKLRDEMKEFRENIGPEPPATRALGETNEDFLSRTIDANGQWRDKILHGYELRFAPRVHHVFHEFGERSLRNSALWITMGKPYQTPESFNEIVEHLSYLADQVGD